MDFSFILAMFHNPGGSQVIRRPFLSDAVSYLAKMLFTQSAHGQAQFSNMREQQNQAAYSTLTPYCQSDHLPAFQYTSNLVFFVYSTDTTMLYSLLCSTDDTMLVSPKGAAFSEGAKLGRLFSNSTAAV